jgi:hypothetical protein
MKVGPRPDEQTQTSRQPQVLRASSMRVSVSCPKETSEVVDDFGVGIRFGEVRGEGLRMRWEVQA